MRSQLAFFPCLPIPLILHSVSICTDNRLVSNTTVTQEYEKLQLECDLNPKQLKDIVIGGFKRSFFPVCMYECMYVCMYYGSRVGGLS